MDYRGDSFTSYHQTDEIQIATPRPQQKQAEIEIPPAESTNVAPAVKINEEGKSRSWKRIKEFIEWGALVLVALWLVVSIAIHKLEQPILWELQMWKWSVFTLAVFSGRLVSSWFVRLVIFLMEKVKLFGRIGIYYAKGLRQSVQVLTWVAFVFLIWLILLNGNFRRSRFSTEVPDFITRTLGSFIIGSFLWILKSLLLVNLRSKFNINSFKDRILIAISYDDMLNKLSKDPKKLGNEKLKRTIAINDMNKLRRIRKLPPWITTKLINIVLAARLDSQSDEDFDDYAKEAAKVIATNVAGDKKFITKDDLLIFLLPEEVDELQLFEGAGDARLQIELQDFMDWTIQAYDEHRELALVLKQMKTAVNDLDKVLTSILLVVALVLWLLLTRIATTKVLIFISSQLLLAAFMFGNTLKTVFESIIFVFIMHPFDVGDRCVVDGVQMTVVEMNILTTVFLKLNKEKVYYPNAVLATKPISNYYRSPDMTDAVEFLFEAPADTIGLVKKKIKKYLEGNDEFWHPNYELLVTENEAGNKIKLILCCKHTMNFQDYRQKNRRRTDLVIHLKKILEEIQMQQQQEHPSRATTMQTQPIVVVNATPDTTNIP